MKKFIVAAVFLHFCFGLNAQNQSTFRADKDTAAEAQIKRLEFILVDLLAKGDIDSYSGYLTDDYIRVAANGTVATKQEVLDAFRKPKLPGGIQGAMIPHDLVVRVYGNTAIMRGILDIESRSGDTVTKRTSIINKVFIKRDGKWYMASMQGTAIQ